MRQNKLECFRLSCILDNSIFTVLAKGLPMQRSSLKNNSDVITVIIITVQFNKHSSLVRKSVNYGRKKFYNIGHRSNVHQFSLYHQFEFLISLLVSLSFHQLHILSSDHFVELGILSSIICQPVILSKVIMSTVYIINHSFCELVILLTDHFVNLSFHKPGILTSGHFVKLSFVKLSFYQLINLSAGHFINQSFGQLVILPTGHFISEAFSQMVILSTGHFVKWSFCQLVILSTSHFCQLDILSTGHFVNWNSVNW